MNSLINTKLNVPVGLLKNVGKMRLTLDESKKSGTLVATGDENISTETKISSRGSRVALVPGRRSRARRSVDTETRARDVFVCRLHVLTLQTTTPLPQNPSPYKIDTRNRRRVDPGPTSRLFLTFSNRSVRVPSPFRPTAASRPHPRALRFAPPCCESRPRSESYANENVVIAPFGPQSRKVCVPIFLGSSVRAARRLPALERERRRRRRTRRRRARESKRRPSSTDSVVVLIQRVGSRCAILPRITRARAM